MRPKITVFFCRVPYVRGWVRSEICTLHSNLVYRYPKKRYRYLKKRYQYPQKRYRYPQKRYRYAQAGYGTGSHRAGTGTVEYEGCNQNVLSGERETFVSFSQLFSVPRGQTELCT